jgi:hypothetical protein
MRIDPVILVSISGPHSGGKMSPAEGKIFLFILLFIALSLVVWGIIILIRYNNIKTRLKKKMMWSASNDSFWEYGKVIKMSQEAYLKAQIGASENTPHIRAKLRQLKRRVININDIKFLDCYVVSFHDKAVDFEDKINVLFEIKNENHYVRYKEIATFRRDNYSLILNGIIKNPTMYMIAHAISIIEK